MLPAPQPVAKRRLTPWARFAMSVISLGIWLAALGFVFGTFSRFIGLVIPVLLLAIQHEFTVAGVSRLHDYGERDD